MSKILLVDDNASNRRLAVNVLELGGHAVIQAKNAQEGLALVHSEQPDVILMDIQMSGMDGMEATRIIKSNPGTSHIKVIALTALAMTGDQERFMAAGFDGYVAKPFNYKALWAYLKDVLGGASPNGKNTP